MSEAMQALNMWLRVGRGRPVRGDVRTELPDMGVEGNGGAPCTAGSLANPYRLFRQRNTLGTLGARIVRWAIALC